jgi:farnesyl-diphosphate farnesyltransferase
MVLTPNKEESNKVQVVTKPGPEELLYPLLKSVSRSFYLTLAILPRNVRPQMALAYLYARAADSIADSRLIPREHRLRQLVRFRQWIGDPDKNGSVLREIQESLSPVGPQSEERALLERLDDCRQVFDTFSREDRSRIREVLEILTGGMERDLRVFPGEDEHHVDALTTLADLDAYTYSVAGCVGDFWTRMMCGHRPGFRDWDADAMAKLGVRFGKGLQLTNVLRDIAGDLRRGRCYIPEVLLTEVGLKPVDLLKPGTLPQFKPVLIQLVRVALDHLDRGWLYTMAIPRREWRIGLACLWPVLFAVKTLGRISVSRHLLDAGTMIKMARREVYGEMAISAAVFGSRRLLTGHYGRLRKRIAC